MKEKLIFSTDVLMHIRDGKWFLSNMRALSHVRMNTATFKNLNDYIDEISNSEGFVEKDFEIVDCTYFTNLNGLMEEPTHIDTTMNIKITGLENVIKFLKNKFILIDNKNKYNEYFNSKVSFFDTEHYGTFHQQMGYNLMTNLRITPDKWWPTQKFTKEWEIKNNLYKYIQLNFFKDYFTKNFVKDKKILDLGCGVGYYSKILLDNGAEVIGIDPNEDYIEKAKNKCKNIGKSDFRVGILDNDSDILKDEKFDIIVISDMLLFYFSPLNPNDTMNPVDLLKLVRKYLKDDGILYITEPHSFFWLAPWMGDEDNPFTIITEYSNKSYSVTPTLSQITKSFSEAKLYVRDIYEPLPSKECEEQYSKRAYNYAKEFPLWWVFILGKRD